MTDKNTTIDLSAKILEKKIQEFWESVETTEPNEVTNMLLLELLMQVRQINVRFNELTDTIRTANDTDSSREVSE